MLARNKRSVVLDLKVPAAQDIVRQLADESDVLIENVRPGALEGFGLAPELLIVRNPKLIVRRVSGDGQTGPYRGKPGFGVVAEAMDGLRHLSGEPGQVPVRVGVSIGDTLAALPGARHAANSDAGRWQRAGRARHCAQTVVHAGAAPPPCARAGAEDTEAAGAGALAAAGAACMVAAFGAAVAVGAAAVCANDNAATVDSRAATIRCLFKVVSNGGRETRFAVAPTLLSRPGFRSACGYNAGFTRVIDSAGKETWPAVFPGSAVRAQAGPAAPAQSPTHVHCATRP